MCDDILIKTDTALCSMQMALSGPLRPNSCSYNDFVYFSDSLVPIITVRTAPYLCQIKRSLIRSALHHTRKCRSKQLQQVFSVPDQVYPVPIDSDYIPVAVHQVSGIKELYLMEWRHNGFSFSHAEPQMHCATCK